MREPPIQIKFRIPGALRDRIKQDAIRAQRSLNSEMIYRLEQSLVAKDIRDTIRECLNKGMQPTVAFGPPSQQNAQTTEYFRGLWDQRAPNVPAGDYVEVPFDA